MRGFARPSRWSISTSTAIAWLLKGRSVCGGRKTASRDQINHQGCQKRPGFRLESDRKLQLSLRFLGRYEIRHLCRGSLARWEEFRVDRAIRQFTDSMAASGAELSVVVLWADILRLSQQIARDARSLRSKKTAAFSALRPFQSQANRESMPNKMPDSRAVAIKFMEFLSDSEINDLSLPLGL